MVILLTINFLPKAIVGSNTSKNAPACGASARRQNGVFVVTFFTALWPRES
jgi:hypothetical protein